MSVRPLVKTHPETGRKNLVIGRHAYDIVGLDAGQSEQLLRELKFRGHDLHLFTNYPDWYRFVEERTELSRYAPWTFVSCQHGVRKPDPEAFQAVLPDQSIFLTVGFAEKMAPS